MRVVGPTYTFSIQRLDNISGVGKYIVLTFSTRIHMEGASIPPSPLSHGVLKYWLVKAKVFRSVPTICNTRKEAK